ncbi:MAG: hypothetical protein ACJ74D_14055, partial [Gaiellaceae bacterium]
ATTAAAPDTLDAAHQATSTVDPGSALQIQPEVPGSDGTGGSSDTVAHTISGATDAVSSAVSSTTDTVASTAEPVVQAAASTTDAVVAAADPVTTVASDTVSTVASTAEPLVQTAASATDAVAASADPLVQSVGSTAEPLVQAAASTDAVVSTTAPVAATTTTTALAPSVDPTQPASMSAALPTETLPSAAVASSNDVAHAIALPPIAPLPTEVIVMPSGDTIAGVASAAPADGTIASASVPGPILSLPGIHEAELLPILGMGAAALSAAVIVRSVCSPSASLLFTNVRLLPCYVNATVQQTTATASSALSSVHSDGLAGRRRDGHHEPLLGAIKEGFGRAVRQIEPRHDGDGAPDARLMAQIGIVLGTVYLAFLTVWFWATRLRWNPRS